MINQKTIHLYNPLKTDFVYEWLDDQDRPSLITLPSQVLTELPEPQALFMAKHLTDTVCLEKGIKNNEEQWKKEYSKIIVYDLD